MKLVLKSLILLNFLMNYYAWPSGAPDTTCSSLMPNHDQMKPSEQKSPYKVYADLLPNNKVKVTISSPENKVFKGFILQAQATSKNDPNKLVDGKFSTDEDTQTINCLKSTLTHVNNHDKKEIVTVWTPNSDENVDVVFTATIVKRKELFWTNQRSNPVSISEDKKDTEKDIIYDGCFETKGCFGLPKDCTITHNCTVLLTYYKVPSGIHFSMHGKLESLEYMSLELLEDHQMEEGTFNACVRNHSNVVAKEFWNKGPDKILKNLPKTDYCSKYSEGLSSCAWVKPYKFQSDGHDFDLFKNYYLLLAMGKVNGGISEIDRRVSDQSVNFTQFENMNEEEKCSSSDGVKFETVSHVTEATEKHEDTSSTVISVTKHPNSSSQLSFYPFIIFLALLLTSRLFKV